MAVPQNVKNGITMWSAVLFWLYTHDWESRGLKGDLCIRVHSSVIHDSNRSNSNVPWWMNGKENVVYPYDGMFLSLRQEGNSDTRYSRDRPWGHHATWNAPGTKGQTECDSTRVWYGDWANSCRHVCVWGGFWGLEGGGSGEPLCSAARASASPDGKVCGRAAVLVARQCECV